MKVGDKVRYVGTCDEQVKWGSNDDPRKYLQEFSVYEISNIDVHTWHTKIELVGYEGKWFNSACLEAT